MQDRQPCEGMCAIRLTRAADNTSTVLMGASQRSTERKAPSAVSTRNRPRQGTSHFSRPKTELLPCAVPRLMPD